MAEHSFPVYGSYQAGVLADPNSVDRAGTVSAVLPDLALADLDIVQVQAAYYFDPSALAHNLPDTVAVRHN